jgi:hypothetical protein
MQVALQFLLVKSVELFHLSAASYRMAAGESGYDLYEPKSAACQLQISVSFFSRQTRPIGAIVMRRRLIARNTPALQEWWDNKPHHNR